MHYRTAIAIAQGGRPVLQLIGRAPRTTDVCQDKAVVSCNRVRVNLEALNGTDDKQVEILKGVFMDLADQLEDTIFLEVGILIADLQHQYLTGNLCRHVGK